VNLDADQPTSSLRWRTLAAALLLVGMIFAIYHRSFDAPFVFDDIDAIVNNGTIRELWSTNVFAPPRDAPVAGRPLVNLSFAVNYHFGGLNPWGYHVVNTTLHAIIALLLWSLLWSLMSTSEASASVRKSAEPLSFLIAAIWALHPLQTEAVVYATQRTELSAALFYILTLAALARARMSPNTAAARAWMALSVLACFTGMFCKEMMVGAPLVALLLDRTFFSSTFTQTIKRHRVYYAALALSMVPAILIVLSQPRSKSVGFNHGISAWEYLNTQAVVILIYVRQVFLPFDLAISNSVFTIDDRVKTISCGLFILLWVGAWLWSVTRSSWAGVAGAVFFFVLAPSSSFVPIATEIMAERRMYLPSAALITLVVIGLWWLVGRLAKDERSLMKLRQAFIALLLLTLGIAGAWSFSRMDVWRSEEKLWLEVIERYPDTETAYTNLGAYYTAIGKNDLAIRSLAHALRLRSFSGRTFLGLGKAAWGQGRRAQAELLLQQALRINPKLGPARGFYGIMLMSQGQVLRAEEQLKLAVEFESNSAPNWAWLAEAQLRMDNPAAAEKSARIALTHLPSHRFATGRLIEALLARGELQAAQKLAGQLLKLDPNDALAATQLARALDAAGRGDDAIRTLQNFTADHPRSAAAVRVVWGDLLIAKNQADAALSQYNEAAASAPRASQVLIGQADALARLGKSQQAGVKLAEAAANNDGSVATLARLSKIASLLGQRDEQVRFIMQALELKPGDEKLKALLAAPKPTD
jgi:protein O-mannosyl-transferase